VFVVLVGMQRHMQVGVGVLGAGLVPVPVLVHQVAAQQ
jgi:hypothetical protein